MQEILDCTPSWEEVALGVGNSRNLVAGALGPPDAQDLVQLVVFVSALACMLPQEPTDVNMRM